MVAKGALTGVREKTVQSRTIGDANQLGGALVIAPGGQVAWSHMSKDAGDNASPEDILGAVRDAGRVALRKPCQRCPSWRRSPAPS